MSILVKSIFNERTTFICVVPAFGGYVRFYRPPFPAIQESLTINTRLVYSDPFFGQSLFNMVCDAKLLYHTFDTQVYLLQCRDSQTLKMIYSDDVNRTVEESNKTSFLAFIAWH